MDIVFIEQFTVMAVIGAYDWEQQRLQKLMFDIELGWDNRLSSHSDDLADCLSYEEVSKTVLDLVTGHRFALIERLAEQVAKRLITQFALPWVRIKLSKPGAVPQAANVGVIIERGQRNYYRK